MLVTMAVTMTGVLVVAAAGSDLSRLMTVKNELQTAADAAALAAGDHMVKGIPTTSSNEALAITAANAVSGNGRVTLDSIRFGSWDPVQRTFTAVADPWLADAVRVVVSTPTKSLFARLLDMPDGRMKVRAVSWQAPVGETWCAKPWFVLSKDVLGLLGKSGSTWTDVTYEDVRQLRDTSKAKRQMQLAEKGKDGLRGHAISLPALEDGGGGSNSGDTYRSSIPKCHRLRPGWHVVPVSGEKIGPTVQGGAEFCKPLLGDVCYNGSGGVGMPAAIPVFDLAEIDGKSVYRVRAVIGFMVTKVIEQGSGAGDVHGYVIGLQGSGGVTTAPTGMTRVRLVR